MTDRGGYRGARSAGRKKTAGVRGRERMSSEKRALAINTATEAVGTFMLVSVILTNGHTVPVAVTLAAMIYFGEKTSGGHYNPAVTLARCWLEDFDRSTAVVYLAAQMAGGFAAARFADEVA